jgi:hypothetical protein
VLSVSIDVRNAVYARHSLALSQNMLSTGLIVWRIWRQHRLSRTIGLQVVNGVSLLEVITIVLESASLYTVQLVVLNITNYLYHPLCFIFQATLVPTAGEFCAIILQNLRAYSLSFGNQAWLLYSPAFEDIRRDVNPKCLPHRTTYSNLELLTRDSLSFT